MEFLFAFESTAAAIGAEQTLLTQGLRVLVMNLPSAIKAGCGIALRLPSAQLKQGVAALAKAGIGGYTVYTRTIQGGASSYTLYAE